MKITNEDAAMVIGNLGREAEELKMEQDEYARAKSRKAKAENATLEVIIEAVRPALPSICSKVEGGLAGRAIELSRGLFLGEGGNIFELAGPNKIRVLDVGQVLDRTSLSAILAVLVTAIRAQEGRLDGRTTQIEREAAILEGIAQAFKIGSVR